MPIIFIGPMASGKTTVAKILEERIGIRNVPMDWIRWYYYFQQDFRISIASQQETFEDKVNYWKTFDIEAVERIITEFGDSIIDFGAGHSYYPEENELEHVKNLLAGFPNVFLLLPSADNEETLAICEARLRSKWPDVDQDYLDFNRKFVEHKSNHVLAKHIVYTKDKTPEEVVEEVLSMLC